MLGTDILAKAKSHVGEEYIFGANVPLENSNWTGPWDCAEFVSWLVYQSYGIIFGCGTQTLDEAEPYTGYWADDARSKGILIPIEQASRTPGAFLIRKPQSNPKRVGHIGVALGDGTIYEAAGVNFGVRVGPIAGRRWDLGMLLPGVTYAGASIQSPAGPVETPLIIRRATPASFDDLVVTVQEALRAKGIDPGRIDGLFGPATEKAVLAFQLKNGLVADGEVGPSTGRALGLDLWGPAPTQGTSVPGAMQPNFQPIATLISSDAFGVIVNKSESFADIKSEYEQLFSTCVVQDKNDEIASLANRIVVSRDRYATFVASYSGQLAQNMPWYFVALVHAMESSGDVGRFRTHLHNGDPLTHPTVQVPKGRPNPSGSNFTWEESARDALSLQKLDVQTDWSLGRMLYYFERYNGFGPRRKGHATAYLWSYSNHYIKGKYVADGVWSNDAVSKQPGVASILKRLADEGSALIL